MKTKFYGDIDMLCVMAAGINYTKPTKNYIMYMLQDDDCTVKAIWQWQHKTRQKL